MAFYLRALCVLFVVSLASCKQGVGDRCEVVADCEPGLICEESQGAGTVKVCKEESTSQIDAQPPLPVDAAGPDAEQADADPTDT